MPAFKKISKTIVCNIDNITTIKLIEKSSTCSVIGIIICFVGNGEQWIECEDIETAQVLMYNLTGISML